MRASMAACTLAESASSVRMNAMSLTSPSRPASCCAVSSGKKITAKDDSPKNMPVSGMIMKYSGEKPVPA